MGYRFPGRVITSLAVGDTDDDGNLEFVWGNYGNPDIVIAGENPTIGVEWQNTNTYFGPFVGARWLRTSADRAQAVFAGAVRLLAVDPATGFVTLSSEIAKSDLYSSVSAEDGVDYDLDGIDEVFLAVGLSNPAVESGSTFSTIAYDFANNMTEWQSASEPGSVRAIVHGDMNGDGSDDMIVLTSGYIIIYDVKKQALLWKSKPLPGLNGLDVAVADLDGDKTLEIIVTSTNILSVYGKSGNDYVQRWWDTLPEWVQNVTVDDIDADGVPDIIVAVPGVNSQSLIRIYDGKSFNQKAEFTLNGWVDDLTLAPVGGNPRYLLVAISDYSGNGQSVIVTIDSVTGKELWRSPGLLGVVQSNSMSFADTNGDGEMELLVGTQDAMYVNMPVYPPVNSKCH